MFEDSLGSEWNFDGAEFYAIFEIKTKFIENMLAWNLEGAYWAARTLRMEIDAKLKRTESNKLLADMEEEKAARKGERVVTEKESVDSMMKEVDQIRTEYNMIMNPDDNQKSYYYQILEKFYMELCYLMKKHRMYFREGEDSRLAILKR